MEDNNKMENSNNENNDNNQIESNENDNLNEKNKGNENIDNQNENNENINKNIDNTKISEKINNNNIRICCVEFQNNNQILIKYEENWTVKDLLKEIIKSKEFREIYSNRNLILNSKRNLILFDLHLCIYRQIKPDYENKISFETKIDDLYSIGLIKNSLYPFFLFKDNKTPLIFPYSPNLIKSDLVKNILDSNYNFSSFYSIYLPRTNTINILNNHPELSNYYNHKKKNYNEFNRYNLNSLIGDQDKYDWFNHNNENLDFLFEMNECEIKVKSLMKIYNGKIYLEDKNEIIKELTDEDLKDFFVNLTYLIINELNEKDIITKKIKITTKTTSLDLIESMNKRVELMRADLKFDSSKKILKVKSLDDYIFDFNEPLIHYNYLIDCVKYGKEAEYVVIDNPEFNQIENNNNIISEYQKQEDNIFKLAIFNHEKIKNEENIDYLNKDIKNIENDNQNDNLDIFIDSLLNDIKINESNSYSNINNEENLNKNESNINEISIYGDSILNSNSKYDYEDIKVINEKLNTSFSMINNLNQSTVIKGTSVMGSKKRKINLNQPNAYTENKEIDIKKMTEIFNSNILMREIDRPFSILLKSANLNKIFESLELDNGNILTFLIFKIQLYCGKRPFSKPKIIKWKTYTKDVNPIFNKRIYFESNYNIIPNICSIMFEIKFIQQNRIKEIISNETKYWGNFNLFDFSKRLRIGQHKINLYESSLKENSYYCFMDNEHNENTSKIYFEIDSFNNSIINKVLHISNYSIDIQSLMVSETDNDKINDIILKTPSEELNNYDREVLWTNRFKIMENPKIISRLISCFNYNDPHHLIELEKLFENSKKYLNTIQSMELLNGYFTYESIRNFAVECLRKSPIEEINQYLFQLVQGLKYEKDVDNELARFLIEISVNYPFTIGHKFYWYLRSEMKNIFFQQKFALYLNVFLNKIGEEISKVFFNEDFLLKNIIKLTKIMEKKKKTNKEKILLFKNSINAFNELLKLSNREISLPYDYKVKIISLIPEKCIFKKKGELSLFFFSFKNADPLSEEINTLFNTNKDLRLNMVTIQIFNAIRNLWSDNNLHLKMQLYNIITTDYNQGLTEIINNSEKLSVIMTTISKKIHLFKKDNPVKNWLELTCKIPSKEYLNNFLFSVCAYLICNFVLGVNDRNNDNIKITFNGELFNIDLNNLFGLNENNELVKGVCNMKFNKEFMGVLENAKLNKEFKEIIWEAYSILRNNREMLFSFLKILIISGIKEMDENNFKYIETSLNLIERNEKKIKQFFEKKFKESC